MADNLRLVTWNGETVTPQDDAILYQSGTVDGVYSNLEFTIKDTTTIHMTGSFAIMGGRFIELEAQDISVPLATTSAGLRGQIYLRLDLANGDNPLELLLETANTLGELTPMTKDEDLNIDDGIYMMQLTVFGVSTSSVFNIQDDTSSELPLTCAILPKSLNLFNGNIAPVEETYFASQNYARGSYLIYNQQLYKVTATITQGNTLEVGTNIQRATLGTDVYNLLNSPVTINKGTNNMAQLRMTAGATKEVIRAYGGDSNGIGILIGAGATAIYSAGESGANAIANDWNGVASGTSEQAYLMADTLAHMVSNANDITQAYDMSLNTAGNLNLPGDIRVLNDSRYASRKYAGELLMNTILKDIVTTREYSIDNQSIPVNTTNEITIPVTPNDGYKLLLGVSGVFITNATSSGSGSTSCVISSFWHTGTEVLVRVRNLGSSAAKVKLTIKQLMVRDI